MTDRNELNVHVGDYRHGNRTAMEIASSPEVAWRALHELRLSDLRLTAGLSAVRSVPGRLLRRGALGSDSSEDLPLLETMTRHRFATLVDEPGEYLALGVIGQFWKLDGGTDVPIKDAAEFIAFDGVGYVKAFLDFHVTAARGGCTLSTETRCLATDDASARRFGLYWLLIGAGSKAIRWDILRATRRRAEGAEA